jgi:hypothetical protein
MEGLMRSDIKHRPSRRRSCGGVALSDSLLLDLALPAEDLRYTSVVKISPPLVNALFRRNAYGGL